MTTFSFLSPSLPDGVWYQTQGEKFQILWVILIPPPDHKDHFVAADEPPRFAEVRDFPRLITSPAALFAIGEARLQNRDSVEQEQSKEVRYPPCLQ